MIRWIHDAGHGGIDTGAVKYGLVEKDLTLEAALYVQKRLKQLGVGSEITRKNDVSLNNLERTNKVKKYDKCISHHYNAGGGSGAEFIHSIYSDGSFEKILKDEFIKAGYPYRRIFTRTYPGNKKLDYYFMHRETGKCRTTIVEYDFLDGPNRERLKDKNYRIGMYECVVKAICRDEGVRYVPVNEKENVSSQEMKTNFESRTTSTTNTLYRVVAGSFRNRTNAEIRVKELKNHSIDTFILQNKIGNKTYYRVIAGSFKNRQNANNRLLELATLGIDSFIDIYKGG